MIIKLLHAHKYKEAEQHTDRADEIIKSISRVDPRRSELAILSTILRDYWNGINDIDDLTSEYQSVQEVLQTKQKEDSN